MGGIKQTLPEGPELSRPPRTRSRGIRFERNGTVTEISEIHAVAARNRHSQLPDPRRTRFDELGSYIMETFPMCLPYSCISFIYHP